MGLTYAEASSEGLALPGCSCYTHTVKAAEGVCRRLKTACRVMSRLLSRNVPGASGMSEASVGPSRMFLLHAYC